jgi:hypothetical protein
MHGVGRNANALRPGRRRTDDRVVPVEIERLESSRVERRERAEVAIDSRQSSQRRNLDRSVVEEIAGLRRIVQCGKDRCLGKSARDLRKDALRAAALI